MSYHLLNNLHNVLNKNISNRPFHMAEWEPWRIEFDDVEWRRIWKNETDVLKARTIKKTSSLLGKNRENYVNYLNNWREIEWKWQSVERSYVDLSNYPMVAGLWINFKNKAEVEKLESRMNNIKESLKYSAAQQNGQPFVVNWTLKNMWNTLIFTAVNWDKEIIKWDFKDFPTLKEWINMHHFINYLNDPKNWMYWSWIFVK